MIPSVLRRGAIPYARFFRWVILAAIFVCLGRMVWENWNEVREASLTLSPFHLILSTIFSVFWYLIQIVAWYLITLRLGIAIPLLETLKSWYYSQLGKYLPGKVWLFLGRFYFYDSEGKSKKALTVALYFETLTMIMAASLVFLFSLLFLREVKPFYSGISPMALIPVFVVAFLFLHPKVLETLFNRILRYLKREPIALAISYPEVLGILGVCVLSWVAGGIGFYFFVDGVFPVPPRYFLFLTGALAISSTLGLVALFAPSGLGVREGVLVYLLSAMMPVPVAVILSVLTRLWMTFIEIGMIGVVYLMDQLRWKKRGKG
jgi:uncharacterized membrane protein YbhN (UPF0104 family)